MWERLQAGEPLPEAVIDVAAERGIDPHELDDHGEGEHGWEPHDIGYGGAVETGAECMALEGCS